MRSFTETDLAAAIALSFNCIKGRSRTSPDLALLKADTVAGAGMCVPPLAADASMPRRLWRRSRGRRGQEASRVRGSWSAQRASSPLSNAPSSHRSHTCRAGKRSGRSPAAARPLAGASAADADRNRRWSHHHRPRPHRARACLNLTESRKRLLWGICWATCCDRLVIHSDG